MKMRLKRYLNSRYEFNNVSAFVKDVTSKTIDVDYSLVK